MDEETHWLKRFTDVTTPVVAWLALIGAAASNLLPEGYPRTLFFGPELTINGYIDMKKKFAVLDLTNEGNRDARTVELEIIGNIRTAELVPQADATVTVPELFEPVRIVIPRIEPGGQVRITLQLDKGVGSKGFTATLRTVLFRSEEGRGGTITMTADRN
jgi:hypothetical protein